MDDTRAPLLEAVLNLSRFHREHEKFYASAPLETAVQLHRHARTLLALADQWATGMPPRENPRLNISVDSVHASGPLGRKHVVIHGNSNYKQTGLLQAWGAMSLLQQPPLRAGFASGCQAFGHRQLLGVLRQFGLVLDPVVTEHR